jgi:hypothetical protein
MSEVSKAARGVFVEHKQKQKYEKKLGISSGGFFNIRCPSSLSIIATALAKGRAVASKLSREHWLALCFIVYQPFLGVANGRMHAQ